MRSSASGQPEVDWDLLRARAVEMMERAYAPYSGYPVGAAALVDDGRLVGGCNVENAAYGVTLCAECGLVSDLVAGGGGRLVAFSCRQLLWEHGGAALLVDTPLGVLPMTEVLPQAFGTEDLAKVGPRTEPRETDGHA
jgi:cytidine deaminase